MAASALCTRVWWLNTDLIDGEGQITLGYMNPVGNVAIANEGPHTLAMLMRRPGESLTALLERLNHAIERVVEHEEYLDEINAN
jgi:hypothetical protein